MLVGSAKLAVADVRRVDVDYKDWLDSVHGDHIASVTATLIPAPNGTSSLGAVSTSVDKRIARFYVTAGALNEVFTVQVQVTDSIGQVVNDTVAFTVVSP